MTASLTDSCTVVWPDAGEFPRTEDQQRAAESRLRRERKWQQRSDVLGSACHYCACDLDVDTYTLDHVVPQSKGGSKSLANLVMACRPCNGAKADMSYEDFTGTLFVRSQRQIPLPVQLKPRTVERPFDAETISRCYQQGLEMALRRGGTR